MQLRNRKGSLFLLFTCSDPCFFCILGSYLLANYPFCTIDPNVVQCIVPDKNFKYLAETFNPHSVVPAVMKVTDIAGLIKGASEGAGLGNAFLSHIAAVDGIYHLVRAFDSDEVIHVDDSVDPIRDLETIQGELCAKDAETLSKVEDKEKERVQHEHGVRRHLRRSVLRQRGRSDESKRGAKADAVNQGGHLVCILDF